MPVQSAVAALARWVYGCAGVKDLQAFTLADLLQLNGKRHASCLSRDFSAATQIWKDGLIAAAERQQATSAVNIQQESLQIFHLCTDHPTVCTLFCMDDPAAHLLCFTLVAEAALWLSDVHPAMTG